MKTKNNTFLTFLDKMQFSEILCLATYDWFCADGSHMHFLCHLLVNRMHLHHRCPALHQTTSLVKECKYVGLYYIYIINITFFYILPFRDLYLLTVPLLAMVSSGSKGSSSVAPSYLTTARTLALISLQ